jgi:hypothetical protein
MRKTVELVEAVIQFCVFVEARLKHEFNALRPADLSPQVQPVITTPGHGSFPSGHCTQSYAVAHVLSTLVGSQPARDVQFQRLAARVSMNRVVAGVHFPVDNLAGRLLGQTLGEYAVARCFPGGAGWLERKFDGKASALPLAETFDPFAPEQSLEAAVGVRAPYYKVAGAPTVAVAASDVLANMWAAAKTECDYLV